MININILLADHSIRSEVHFFPLFFIHQMATTQSRFTEKGTAPIGLWPSSVLWRLRGILISYAKRVTHFLTLFRKVVRCIYLSCALYCLILLFACIYSLKFIITVFLSAWMMNDFDIILSHMHERRRSYWHLKGKFLESSAPSIFYANVSPLPLSRRNKRKPSLGEGKRFKETARDHAISSRCCCERRPRGGGSIRRSSH